MSLLKIIKHFSNARPLLSPCGVLKCLTLILGPRKPGRHTAPPPPPRAVPCESRRGPWGPSAWPPSASGGEPAAHSRGQAPGGWA